MIYIVDANNLAGRFGILEEDNFNELLFEMVEGYFSKGENEVFLVFDSNDPMGDKKKEGNITIIFAPRDGKNYNCADDKILELAKNKMQESEPRDEITVVSDDNELKNKVEILAEEQEYQKLTHLLSCTKLTERINKMAEAVNDDFFDPHSLNEDDQEEITEELKELWN